MTLPPTSDPAPPAPPDPMVSVGPTGAGPTGAGPTGAGPTGAAPRSRYSMGSLPNMLRSLLVIGVFLVGLIAVVPRISQVDRPAVDAAGKAAQTAAQTKWAIEMPAGLGGGWVPTVATYAPGTEQVPTFTTVWSTPSGADVALKEAVGVTDLWLRRSVNNGIRSGEITLAGRTFERYVSQDGKQVSYVARGPGATGLTIAATTTGPENELKSFITALAKVTPAA